MADTYENFLREDADYERALDHREELEREDIIDGAVTGWLRSQRIARRPPQPVAAILDSAPANEWEAA